MENQSKQRIIELFTTDRTDDEGLTRYELKTSLAQQSEESKIQVLTVGPQNGMATLSVLLLGETGAGKTLLLNGLANIFFGVEAEDDYRFVLKDQTDGCKDEVHSQTDYITAYVLYSMEGLPVPYNLRIIDTPGFGDTRPQETQDCVETRLSSFLMDEASGIDDLHCVGLVAKANQNKLSEAQRKILDSFSLLLSQDVGRVTQLLATFATDGVSQVEAVVRAAGVRFCGVYLFDNWPLFKARNDENEDGRREYECRWKKMKIEQARFLKELSEASPVSVKIIRLLQKERRQLCEARDKLKEETKQAASEERKLDELKRKVDELKEKAECINFICYEKHVRKDQRDVESQCHTHNCQECNMTCSFCQETNFNNMAANGLLPVAIGSIFSSMAGSLPLNELADNITPGAESITPGLILPDGIGAGVAVGVAAGIGIGMYMAKKRKPVCNKFPSDDECIKCSHKMSQHSVEDFEIIIVENWEEKVDLHQKAKYDRLQERIRETEARVKEAEEKLTNHVKNLEVLAARATCHIRTIKELSFKAEPLTTERFLRELVTEVREANQIRLLENAFASESAFNSREGK